MSFFSFSFCFIVSSSTRDIFDAGIISANLKASFTIAAKTSSRWIDLYFESVPNSGRILYRSIFMLFIFSLEKLNDISGFIERAIVYLNFTKIFFIKGKVLFNETNKNFIRIYAIFFPNQ